jgi:hypothetical protein
MIHRTVTLDALPRPFDSFEHPEIAEGHRMTVAALSIDERQRSLRLDLAYGAKPRRQQA